MQTDQRRCAPNHSRRGEADRVAPTVCQRGARFLRRRPRSLARRRPRPNTAATKNRVVSMSSDAKWAWPKQTRHYRHGCRRRRAGQRAFAARGPCADDKNQQSKSGRRRETRGRYRKGQRIAGVRIEQAMRRTDHPITKRRLDRRSVRGPVEIAVDFTGPEKVQPLLAQRSDEPLCPEAHGTTRHR